MRSDAFIPCEDERRDARAGEIVRNERDDTPDAVFAIEEQRCIGNERRGTQHLEDIGIGKRLSESRLKFGIRRTKEVSAGVIVIRREEKNIGGVLWDESRNSCCNRHRSRQVVGNDHDRNRRCPTAIRSFACIVESLNNRLERGRIKRDLLNGQWQRSTAGRQENDRSEEANDQPPPKSGANQELVAGHVVGDV